MHIPPHMRIQISDIQPGDYCRAKILCQNQRPGVNTPNTWFRNGKITEIIGNIVRIDIRSRRIVACQRHGITDAWRAPKPTDPSDP